MWTLQIQLLPQIIINRINVILGDRRLGNQLKWGVAGIILAINISVYCIWIPAVLGVSETLEKINYYWDRIEKSIYLVIDAFLNYYFVRVVKQRLVNQGSKKYNRLVTFNIRIIIISLAMDVLIIASMQLRHTLLYSQIHPLAFMVKLRIELSMASLIRRIASEKNEFRGTYSGSDSRSRGTAPLSGTRLTELRTTRSHHSHAVHELSDTPNDNLRVEHGGIIVKKQVVVESVLETTEREREREREAEGSEGTGRRGSGATDQRPLKEAVNPHGW
ncbi:hypothetical protein EX30DRAFT_220441 [Ascodesmis nigricans]|uniref:Uncharacterized protein n=1 Tax=Ascodesmis nigricans TaxID=341454 RepID=A0A4S2MZL3_9PEZI|nr:hypothetical protein EX30DRAFT_220441 [Ascodesmis nigricans]